MNPLDWAIVAVVGLSALLGLWRGLVREVFALAGWVVAIWLALRHASTLGAALPFDPGMPSVRTAVAALVIVVGVLIVATLMGWLLGKLLAAVKLGPLDRSLGGLFGLARGLLIVLVLVFLGSRTALAQEPLWRGSTLLPHVEAAVRFAAPHFPPLLPTIAPRAA